MVIDPPSEVSTGIFLKVGFDQNPNQCHLRVFFIQIFFVFLNSPVI